MTRITASITAYSAMSWPLSSDHAWRRVACCCSIGVHDLSVELSFVLVLKSWDEVFQKLRHRLEVCGLACVLFYNVVGRLCRKTKRRGAGNHRLALLHAELEELVPKSLRLRESFARPETAHTPLSAGLMTPRCRIGSVADPVREIWFRTPIRHLRGVVADESSRPISPNTPSSLAEFGAGIFKLSPMPPKVGMHCLSQNQSRLLTQKRSLLTTRRFECRVVCDAFRWKETRPRTCGLTSFPNSHVS